MSLLPRLTWERVGVRGLFDFACTEKRLIVELDGEYHEHIYQRDQSRQHQLEAAGWKAVRFSNADVLDDVESVAIAIARLLDIF